MRANKVKEIWAAGGVVRNGWLSLDCTMRDKKMDFDGLVATAEEALAEAKTQGPSGVASRP